MNLDTTAEVETVLFKMGRETPTWRKMELMKDMNRAVCQLAFVGLRRRHPDASEEQLQRRLADILLGEELAATVYGLITVQKDFILYSLPYHTKHVKYGAYVQERFVLGFGFGPGRMVSSAARSVQQYLSGR
jgi:hypothetical protein